MRGATTWHGRRGTVILGPTEHRVARWLADMCKAGRITLRTVELAEACNLERSEAYRITARLRILGLFGIENDRGGNHQGRRFWRTSIEHDASQLDATRHKEAWARIVAWARARADRLHARLAAIRGDHTRPVRSSARTLDGPTPAGASLLGRARSASAAPGIDPPPESGGSMTFLDRLIAGGLPAHLAARFGGGVQ